MELLRENTEIRDQLHLMDAEGTSDQEPTEINVQNHLFDNGEWVCSNIDIFYDNMMKFWRWSCKIKKS